MSSWPNLSYCQIRTLIDFGFFLATSGCFIEPTGGTHYPERLSRLELRDALCFHLVIIMAGHDLMASI